METDDLEKQRTHCQGNSFDYVNLDIASTSSEEQIGPLAKYSAEVMELDSSQAKTVCTSNNEQQKPLLVDVIQTAETELLHADSNFSVFNAFNNNSSTSEATDSNYNEAENLVDSTMETILPQIESVFSEYNTYDDGVFAALEAVTDGVQAELLSETPLPAVEVNLPQIESVFSECNAGCGAIEAAAVSNSKDNEMSELPQITSICGAYDEVDNSVFGLLDDVSTSNHEGEILLETSAPAAETVLPQIEAVYSECDAVNNGDDNFVTEETLGTETEAVQSEPAQIQANFNHHETNASVFSLLDTACLSNNEVDMSETSAPMTETALPQIQAVYSDYKAVNICDVEVEGEKTPGHEEVAQTPTQAAQIEPAQMKVISSDSYVTSNGVLDKLNPVAPASDEEVEIMETELPKISLVESECDTPVFSDETAMNQCNQVITDAAQTFSKFEGFLGPDNAQVSSQIAPSGTEAHCGDPSCNKKECSTCNKESEIKSSQIAAQVTEFPQITANNECTLTHDSTEKPLAVQTDSGTIVEDSQGNEVCDNPRTTEAQDAAAPLDTTKNDSIKEAWKEIAIKKEIMDVDEEEGVGSSHLNASIKTEFIIKLEDEEKERNFECRKCQKKFYLECVFRLHMVVHRRRKPMRCDECSFKCKKRRLMLSHLRNHTGEKRIPCKICKGGYYFFNVVEHFQKCLKRKKYNCDECEYNTGQKFYYERHMRLHTGERLKCSRCDSLFLDNVARKKHFKCHTKEKPYECHICYKRFKQKVARERHILAYCDRRCPKCEYVSIYCTDFYEHVKEVHPFTKLKIRLQQYYRAYDNMKRRWGDQFSQFNNSDPADPLLIEPKYEPQQDDEANLWSLPETKFIKFDASQTRPQKVEQNVTCETEQNVCCEPEQNVGCKTEEDVECKSDETSENKAKWNTDYELIQNIKYELVEDTESCGPNTDYEAMNFCSDYESVQDVKWDASKNYDDSFEGEMEENIDYDLIQNVNCELTESSEDYTLLCL